MSKSRFTTSALLPALVTVSALVAAVAAPPSPAPALKRQQAAKSAPPPLRLPKPNVTPSPVPARPNLLLPSEYMPTAQIKPGMKGYGLSVFHGTQIERFDVTILGVMRKVNDGRDLILVKLSGPNMRRVTDVIAGMSGSPVYVNGRIVGAVSYGAQFTKESIGYLTPIEDMLEAWDPALPQSPFGTPEDRKSPVSLAAPIEIEGRQYTRVAFARPGMVMPRRAADTLTLRPLGTKVTVSGVSGLRFARVAAVLGKLGLEARQGGGALMNPGLKGSAMVPGGAIGMSLATGDIDITGIGTLTYRRGNQVVAFGHPFLGIGPLDAPMFTAYIHDIEPSYAESSKIGSPVEMVGSFSQDRPFSISGRIGARPILVPISVRVNDRVVGRDRVFNARVIRHPQITPILVPMAASTAIAEVHGQPGDVMATVTTEVTADDIGTVRRTNVFYDAASIDAAATGDLETLVGLLSSNPFYPVAIRSVKMNVTIEPGRHTAQVERIFLKQTRFEPGDLVDVGIVLKPYKQERVVRNLTVRIPPSAPAGMLMLTVQGGAGGGGFGGGLSIGGMTILRPGGGSDYANAATVRQLVRKYEEKDRNDALVAKLALPTAAISVEGEKFSGLPPNIEMAMRGGSRSSGVRLERDEVKVSENTPFVLSGAQSLAIRVVRHDQSERPALGSGGDSSGSGVPGGVPAFSNPALPGSGSSPGGTPGMSPFGGGDPDDAAASGFPAVGPRAAGVITPAAVPPAGDGTDDSTIPDTGTTIVPIKRVGVAPPALLAPNGSIGGGAITSSDPVLPRAIGRQPGVWRHTTASDFRLGKLDGVTVTSLGDVRLAPRLRKVAESVDPYFWSLAPADDNGIFVGSGDGGVIYRLGADEKLTEFARTGELEVQSLVRGGDGTLYAGTAPNGRIFRMGKNDSKPTLLLQTREKYVLSLALSPDGGTLYAATGGPVGRVYAVSLGNTLPVPEPTVLYNGAGESSVTTLAVGADGALYGGTAPNGLVVRIAGPGTTRPMVLYDAAEPSISGLAVSKKGVVYAATAPRGVVYRIAPGEATRVVYERAPGGTLNGLVLASDNTLYTTSGATVVALDPSADTVRTYEAPSDIQILSLLPASDGNGLWVSTGNAGGVYRLGGPAAAGATSGEITSNVLDAKAVSHWGTLRWMADVPAGASVYLQTRSGNTAEPDATWSDWSRFYTATSGDNIASPPARYLQYRAHLERNASATTDNSGPLLRSVEVFYLPPNQAPQVALLAPRGGEVWRGTKSVRWNGTDPDRDMLSYEVSVSADGGRTWEPIAAPGPTRAAGAGVADGLSSATHPMALPTTVTAVATPGRQKALAGLEAELDRHPEINPEMRARILADAPGQVQQALNNAGGESPTTVAVDLASAPASVTRETTLPLDTTKLPDGVYQLRVTASDRPSNPENARANSKVSGEFRVANKPPILVLFNRTMTVLPDRSVRIEGIAMHRSVAVRAVQYRVDNSGDWIAAIAADGIFDSLTEAFHLTTAPLSSGAHTIEVQAMDEAGNVATQKATVTVR